MTYLSRAFLAPRKSGGLPPFIFDLSLCTFTAAMDKRLSPGPFYTAPIIQGKLDTTGTPDALSLPRGDLLGNQTQYFYANFDPYQGSIVLWWTPEVSSADRVDGTAYFTDFSAAYNVRYKYSANRFEAEVGNQVAVVNIAITAGTTYQLTWSYNALNPIDGTNY